MSLGKEGFFLCARLVVVVVAELFLCFIEHLISGGSDEYCFRYAGNRPAGNSIVCVECVRLLVRFLMLLLLGLSIKN